MKIWSQGDPAQTGVRIKEESVPYTVAGEGFYPKEITEAQMAELKVITDKKLKDVLDQAQLKKEIEYEDAYYSDIVNTTNYTMNDVESYFAYEEGYLSNNIYGTIYKVVFNGNVESPGRWSDSKKGDKLIETRYIRVSVTGLVANKDGKINEDLLEIKTTLNSEHREQSRATKDFMDSLVRDAKVVKMK